jgi:4-hydroxybenzoate polyprenyltransferase
MIRDYLDIARPSHWVKNVFVAPGLILAFFFQPDAIPEGLGFRIFVGMVAACLIASSNYVLNEILDAPSDLFHPEKKARPVPSGRVSIPAAYAEWLLLAGAGFALSALVNRPFLIMSAALWVMGIVYNVRPLRTKDRAYLDVLSESVNNPIRLAMGWHIAGLTQPATLSVLGAYWMFGAFLMAAKRFAEYRHIGDPARAASYRKSFGYYTEARLVVSILAYVTLFGMFAGVFISRYRMEELLAAPLVALAISRYMRMAYTDDSLVQHPEKLHKDPKLFLLVTAAFVACAILMFVDVPAARNLFLPQFPPSAINSPASP